MKAFILFFAAAILLASCGGKSSSGSGSDTTTASADNTSAASNGDLSSNPDYQRGQDLVNNSADCGTCHKIAEKVVGPSFQDIANKYAGSDTAVDYLAQRIIKGVGATDKKDWGSETNEAIMTAHPDLDEDSAKAMVKYILLLKTK